MTECVDEPQSGEGARGARDVFTQAHFIKHIHISGEIGALDGGPWLPVVQLP